MRVFSICRGAPGLGRVAPSLGLSQTLARVHGAHTRFASYAAGYAYLQAIGQDVVKLGSPDGLFIDAVAPQALQVLELAEAEAPDLILIDGEFYLPATLVHLGIPIVYLANPHDLLGPANTFRRVNRLLLGHAAAVIISSLSCGIPQEISALVPGAACLQVPPIIKEFVPGHRTGTDKPRVLVSMGGGSIGADLAFRAATDEALNALLNELKLLVDARSVGAVTVVLGADGRASTVPTGGWLTVVDRPVELTAMYADHEVLIARAGRNVIAEAMYCGIPTVLIPIITDRHRGSEQSGNAEAAQSAYIRAVSNWQARGSLRQALTEAVTKAHRPVRRTGSRGNGPAAALLADLCASVGDDRCSTAPV